MATGIRKRHSRRCGSRDGGACSCTPSVEAFVWDQRRKVKVTKTFSGPGAFAAARGWRTDAEHAKKRGRVPRQTRQTVYEAAVELVAGMAEGSVLSSRDRRYKPSTIRAYRRALGLDPEQRLRAPVRVVEALGDLKLTDVDKHAIRGYADLLRGDGWDPSTIANQLDTVRVIFRVARDRDELAIDPFAGVKLAKPTGRRERIAQPAEAAALLEALEEEDRPLWATYCYAGLRRGEARALRVAELVFDQGVIRVRRGWDDVEGAQDGKTDNAARDVPIVGLLRGELLRHLARTGRRGDELVFGEDGVPFSPSTTRRRALEAWQAAGLEPITPHEARHTFASLLIAAGVDIKQVSEYMGHSSIQITADRYGHLFADARERAVKQVDAFLAGPAEGRLRSV
jgi:integrase